MYSIFKEKYHTLAQVINLAVFFWYCIHILVIRLQYLFTQYSLLSLTQDTTLTLVFQNLF